ncbi:MAG: NAD(P)/FAD-dependent oxidoreductase [Gammaproteobacteria bacterium]|nr:NAD(P)/FAD-dependent oxidoreductase [Gammaproteobacteria bacterium]
MRRYQAVIIGAGFGGICMAVKLKAAGINDFIILEQASGLGGTWRDNIYPGAECDIPSSLYSFSFALNSHWKFKWSEQSQILQYQKDTAEKYGVTHHIRYNQRVESLSFDEKSAHWNIQVNGAQPIIAQHSISAVGQLHVPAIPTLAGQQAFGGDTFHSARWRQDVDLTNKRVAVIGNAASAVQFIPQIAEQCAQLTIFQRSPNWMLPKVDRLYRGWEQWLSDKVPALAKLYRFLVWAYGEWLILPAIKGNRVAAWIVKTMCRWNLNKYIKDPELRQQLTPDYPIGAKRILFCDDYYPVLNLPNVSLESNAIDQLTTSGLRTGDGREHSFDVVIYATGFVTNPFLSEIDVIGIGGQTLSDAWAEGAHAYLGVATHGFPNLHFLYGPNTNLGHSSIIIMLEAQADYIVQAINHASANGVALDIDATVEQTFDEEVQARLQRLAWHKIDASWYKVGERIPNNWAGSTWEYRRRLRRFDADRYQRISPVSISAAES